MIDSNRINNPPGVDAIDEAEIAQALGKGRPITVQFSRALYTDAILEHINRLCRRFGEQLCVRFYGFYGTSFDAGVVRKIPEVRSLYIDCLDAAHNLEAIHDLQHLRELSLGVYHLAERDILAGGNLANLRKLTLGEIRPGGVNLKPLRHYKSLCDLYISDQSRDIEAIKYLSTLESLSLSSIKKVRLDFINDLPALKSLHLILGGRDNIDEVDGHRIEDLEIVRVRGFGTFAHLPKWTALKRLKIEDQARLESLAFSEAQRDLTDLWLFNCKALASLKGLAGLPKLDSIRLSGTSIDIEALRRDGLPKSLRRLEIYAGSLKKNQQLRQAIRAMGYETAPDWP